MTYKFFWKRFFDLTLALFAFIMVMPLFLLLTIILAIANQGHPFFFQSRPGRDEKIFRIIKFKTMNDKKDDEGNLLPNKDRITRVGSVVRKSSLDEIPQLINVIKGDMSLIGPRPLLVDYLPLYNQFQARRHEMRPGITGWAQVNGRNAISWDEKFRYDIYYIENCSLKLDLKIIWLTILKVLKTEGVSATKEVTMERFTGN